MTEQGKPEREVLHELVLQLDASERRLALIIERSPDAFVVIDGEGVIQFVNGAAAELFGTEAHALVGRPFGLPLVAGETTAVDIVSAQGSGLVAEMRVVETEWGGKRVHVAALRDITERSRAETLLRENERRLTLAMDAARLGFWDIDLASGRVTDDGKVLRGLGYEPGDIAPRLEAWRALAHPADLPRTDQAFGAHLQGATPAFREELRMRAKSGEWRWVLAQGEAVERDGAGAPLRVIGVSEDITERKRAELEHETTLAMLNLAVGVAGLGFWEWQPHTEQVYFSPEWKRQLGYADDELPDRYEEFASRLHPDDRVQTLTAQLGYAGLPRPVLEMEYRLRHRKGGYRWIAARMVQVHDAAGRLTRLLGTHLDITEQKEIEDRIRQVSQHDPLTGLPNRALLYEFAEHLLSGADRDGKCVAFLFVDLDRFKPINDTHGHAVGDAVLKEVAGRLSQCVRGRDLVARLGGDEFLVVLSHVRSEDDAAKAASHALASLGEPFLVDGLELTVTPSIGISLFPHDGKSLDTLIKHADTAMYHVKDTRKNDYEFFRGEFNAHAQQALKFESRLREGLAQREFVLFYQAEIDTETDAVVGAEALLRWPGMEAGPRELVAVAEKAGIMPALGDWVVREACRQQREWHDKGLSPFPVAVNVSSVQFRDKHFAHRVRSALNGARLRPGELRMEMTERTVMSDVEEAAGILQALRAMGVTVALDDFGTGYSSLRHLSQLPIDILKLGRSFVKGAGQNGASFAVADGVLALGRSLGLEVIAAGVESEEALARLRARQCRRGQGFHFCRPMPAAEFEQWCRRRRPSRGQPNAAGE